MLILTLIFQPLIPEFHFKMVKKTEQSFSGYYQDYNYICDLEILYTIENDSFNHEFGFQSLPDYLLIQETKIVKIDLTDFEGNLIIPSDIMIIEIKEKIESSKDFRNLIDSLKP